MAAPDRDNYYTRDGTERTTTVYRSESNATAWFVGIIVALALLAIGYLVFSANSGPSTTNIQNTPAVTAPAPETTVPDTGTTPMTTAPANDTAPANTDTGAPADTGTPAETPAPAAPAPATPAAPAAQ
jgi:hypothetical protein